MTESAKFTDKFLTCPICHFVFDDPATLHCGHTYCRKCITSLIKSRPDAIRDKVIPCVLRCEGTRVPDTKVTVEKWANQIKPNFIITYLMDEFTSKSGNNCSRCRKSSNVTVKWCPKCRQSLCEGCTPSHRRDRTTRLHTLTDLPSRVEKQKQQYVRCQDHRDEVIKLICEDCNKAICNTCCSLHHRQCKSVVLMETKLQQIQANILDHKSKLEEGIENQTFNIAKFHSKVDEIERIKSNAQANIRSVFEKITKLIQKKESSLLKELEKVTETDILTLQEKIQAAEASLQMYQQRSYFIDMATKSGSINDMYNMYQCCQSPDESPWETDNMPTGRNVTDVTLSFNSDQLVDTIDKLDFGTLEVKYDIATVQNESSNSPVLVGVVNGKLPDDDFCNPYDITALVVNGVQTVVVSDHHSKCLISFYTKNNKSCRSKLLLNAHPHCIALLKKNQVLVALSFSKQIVTVEATPDLVQRSTITTGKGYESLAVLNSNEFAAGGIGCVDIINVDGQVIKTISARNGEYSFTSPSYMCVSNKGNLLVSDNVKRSVTCMTLEGDVVWKYASTALQDLMIPGGIACVRTGDVLIVDKYSHKVIQLTKSGQYVRDVLTTEDDLSNPQGIYIDKDNSLFVCEESGQIKQFKFM